MGILDLFRRKAEPPPETRSSGTGYTAQIMAARASWIAGQSGLAELTAAAQSCVSLWESAFATADVDGAPILDRRTMALIGRALALRGEFVGLIRDGYIVPAADWEVSTRDGIPRAYRLSIPEAGGARSETALAPEVLHVRHGSDPVAPWSGTAPLRRAALSAELLHHVETALRDTWRDAPIGSQVVPLPDSLPEDMAAMRAGFLGKRGSVLVIEGVAQATAAGMNPQLGQRREDLAPDLAKTAAPELWRGAQGAVLSAFGVLPALINPAVTGPVVREAQRHLSQWTLEPLGKVLADEATAKLGGPVSIDMVRPLQAFDVGGKARAVLALVGAGLSVDAALRLVDVDPTGQAVTA
jgi:hypothetical protein